MAKENYFDPEWVARRYATARPNIHPAVTAHLERVLDGARIDAALDVGCGTGLSTRALLPLAEKVIGVDPAPFMLREAHDRGGAYVRGSAEQLPIAGDCFDLVTVGCAYHWCDAEAFLGEAHRVLRPGGTLALYDNFFHAQLPRSSAVMDWLRGEYYSATGVTPRNPPPDSETFSRASFELLDHDEVEVWVPLSRAELVDYLTTQSTTVNAVESGQRTLAESEKILHTGLEPLVPESGAEFRFAGPIWVARSL